MTIGVAVPLAVRERISKTKKEQAVRGSSHMNSILTEEDVKTIVIMRKEKRLSEESIAHQYGVSRSTISAILRGWTWGHVTGLGDGRNQKRAYKSSRQVREGVTV